MFFSPRVKVRPLVGLCRRLSTALEAGIDIRTAWSREAGRTSGALRRHLLAVSRAIDRGESLADALAPTRDFFPTLFRDMVGLGEPTGHLDAILARLADHYQFRIDMRRVFLASILWPIVQLGIAIVVVGGLIWLSAVLGEVVHRPELDLLGFGLVGNRGLAIYATGLGVVFVLAWLFMRAVRRGLVWTRPLQRLVLCLPIVGKPLQTVALARLAWSMHVTLYAGMDLRQALKLSLRSTQNARYTDKIPLIDAEIRRGNSIHQAFSLAGGYPAEFLDTVAVGEDSGRLVESMAVLARQYHDQARSALTILTTLAGWVVWAGVGALIVLVVFRLFGFYIGVLNDATRA